MRVGRGRQTQRWMREKDEEKEVVRGKGTDKKMAAGRMQGSAGYFLGVRHWSARDSVRHDVARSIGRHARCRAAAWLGSAGARHGPRCDGPRLIRHGRIAGADGRLPAHVCSARRGSGWHWGRQSLLESPHLHGRGHHCADDGARALIPHRHRRRASACCWDYKTTGLA